VRETQDRKEEADRLFDDISKVLGEQGYYTTKSEITRGRIVEVFTRSTWVCDVFLFLRGGRWWWYRNIAGGRVQNRDHLLALSRASATVMVWARKNDLRWAPTSIHGKELRPLSEVQ
jgi:hypothetical protein